MVVDADRAKGIKTLWDVVAEIKTHIGDRFWTIEMRLPLAGNEQNQILPLQGVSGELPTWTYRWYFNICRGRVREHGGEWTACSPTGKKAFHFVDKFAKLVRRDARRKRD